MVTMSEAFAKVLLPRPLQPRPAGILLVLVLVTLIVGRQAQSQSRAPQTIVAVDEIVRRVTDLVLENDVLADGNVDSVDQWQGGGGGCRFDGREITFAHPMSLHPTDRFYSRSYFMMKALHMTVEAINAWPVCGVRLQGRHFAVSLRTLADESDAATVAAIARDLVGGDDDDDDRGADFLLAGYSSALTRHLTTRAAARQRLTLTAGSNAVDVYADNPYAFGILHPATRIFESALRAVAEAGAQTVVYVGQEGVPSAQFWNQAFVDPYGLQLIDKVHISGTPTLIPVAERVMQLEPDVVVLASLTLCAPWIQALRHIDWLPKAMLLGNCIDRQDLVEAVGVRHMSYMTGLVNWSPLLPRVRDAVTGWTPAAFAALARQRNNQGTTYQAAAASASLSVYVQAMQRANSTDQEAVRQVLAQGTFPTVFGNVSFDVNGQGTVPSLLVQYDMNGTLHAVGRPGVSFDDDDDDDEKNPYSLVYPMPSWTAQDCIRNQRCVTSGGTCQANGTCSCVALEQQGSNKNRVSVFGQGSDTFCKVMPEEDMGYIADWIIIVGVAFFAVQALLSLAFVVWVYRHRERTVVKASQPIFLIFIALGCLILASSIVPRTMQAEYRYEQDFDACTLTEEPNKDVEKVDAACMASHWLFAVGFCVIFSALFAKIRRVQELTKSALRFRRNQVEAKDVAYVMIIMLGFVIGILLVWQLVDPLQWKREALEMDADGCTVRSVGKCTSKNENSYFIFIGTFTLFAILCLGYALYLSYVTRKNMLAEGTWITAAIISIFQIMLLAVPVMFIVKNDTNVYFFVGACLTFLMSVTISLLIFLPKIYETKFTRSGSNPLSFEGGRGFSHVNSLQSVLYRSNSIRNSAPFNQHAVNEKIRAQSVHQPSDETCCVHNLPHQDSKTKAIGIEDNRAFNEAPAERDTGEARVEAWSGP